MVRLFYVSGEKKRKKNAVKNLHLRPRKRKRQCAVARVFIGKSTDVDDDVFFIIVRINNAIDFEVINSLNQ